MLEARGLVKRFAGIAVVSGVSVELTAGRTLGILGPNGAGKSTTVKMLTGLIEPSEGHVFFRGRPIGADLTGFRTRLGYVPEEPHLYAFLSGREYLEFIGHLRGLPQSLLDRKIPALLDLLGILGAAEQSIASYSKGMRQKVLLIAALLHDPEVLIFDEPESGLDVAATLVLRHLVASLAASGKAILYSSHILEVVEKVCAEVLILQRGRIVAQSTVADLPALQQGGTLEAVFSQLVLTRRPEDTARELAEVVAWRP